MPPWLLDLDTLIKDIRGEELAPNFTIRADVNFVDLHSFVEGPKFWKTFPLKQRQMSEMLLHPKSYLQYNTTNLNTENKYFCNIVMVGHFTFGLCLFVVSNFGTNSSLQPTHWPTLEQGQMPEMLLHLNTENKYCFVILSWSDISHLVFVRAYKVVRDCKGCLLVRFLMHWT